MPTRDPNRIPIILKKVEEAWKKSPDMRLGQLVSSAAAISTGAHDCFYTEDDKMEAGLDEMRKW